MILCNTMEKFMAEFVVEMNTLGVEKVDGAMRRVLDVTQKTNSQPPSDSVTDCPWTA